MGIIKINIKNYKALKNIRFQMDRDLYQIQCLLGKNGTGKSSLLDAVEYYYTLLNNNDAPILDVIDTTNHYIQKMEIEIEYDFSKLTINNSNPYFDEQLMELNDLLIGNKMKVKLIQYKDKKIEWLPHKLDFRKRIIIGKLFPIYTIDTRFISLQNWSNLWGIISDISISKMKIENEQIEEKLDKVLEEIYGDKYKKTLKFIKQVFASENIKIGNSDYRDKYKNALITRMGGDIFISNDNSLEYYSDGLNSLKYIKLVFEIIAELSKTGWKNPLLLFDEPEIGLHPQYIDELVKSFEKKINNRISVIISTHSTHFISEMIKNDISVGINRVFMYNGYSNIERIKDIIEEKQKYLINDTEIECYFANVILFVEGKSEIQLFKNRNINKLFPRLTKVKIYNYDSDNATLNLIYPDIMKFSIPYYTVVDMDKIVCYSYQTNKFKIKRDSLVNPLYSSRVLKKQKYLVYTDNEKKKNTYNLKLRIVKMLKKTTYTQSTTTFWIDDYFYNLLKEFITLYCKQYNVIPMDTTIEGAIVNLNNVEIVLDWLKTKLSSNEINILDRILNREDPKNKKFRTTILRSILNGKLDTFKNYNEKEVVIEQSIKNSIDKIKKNVGKKTSGWIGEFIDFYFDNYINRLSTFEEKSSKFAIDFYELNSILQMLSNMVKCQVDEYLSLTAF